MLQQSTKQPSTLYLLHQASQAVRSRLESHLREFQITGIQYTVLAILGSRGRPSSAELSRRFFVTPQTMNEIVAGMERRGLILRTEDADNRRVLRLALTDEGRAMLAHCERVAEQVDAEAFGWVESRKIDELRELLRHVLEGNR